MQKLLWAAGGIIRNCDRSSFLNSYSSRGRENAHARLVYSEFCDATANG